MEQSPIYQHADFLRELGHGNRRDQRMLIRRASRYQFLALSEVVRHILDGLIPVLNIDVSVFRRKRRFLRQLISRRIALERKKSGLLSHLSLVSRLLRDRYLARILIYSVRAREN